MAQSFTNAYHTGYQRFLRRIQVQPTFYSNFCSPIVEQNPTFVETEVYGGDTYAAVASSPTPDDIVSANSSTTMAAFEKVYKLATKDTKDIPGLIANSMEKLGTLAMLTLDKAFIAGLTTLDVTLHPENGGGVYTAQGAGTVKFCDKFTIDGPNAASFNQDNLFTDELDADALTAALAARWEYRDKDGNRIDSMEKPILVVSADNETLATDLLALTGPTYDGSGLRSGSFGSRIEKAVTLPGAAADPQDWWLMWPTLSSADDGTSRRSCGITPVLRGVPQISIENADSSHHIFVKGFFEYALHYSTWEGNVQMHSPNTA